jgi:hypothetical protein
MSRYLNPTLAFSPPSFPALLPQVYDGISNSGPAKTVQPLIIAPSIAGIGGVVSGLNSTKTGSRPLFPQTQPGTASAVSLVCGVTELRNVAS